MNDPTTEIQMIDLIKTRHEALLAVLKPLTEAQLTQPGVEDKLSVKDILAHITLGEQADEIHREKGSLSHHKAVAQVRQFLVRECFLRAVVLLLGHVHALQGSAGAGGAIVGSDPGRVGDGCTCGNPQWR